jgi:hypothetical protein
MIAEISNPNHIPPAVPDVDASDSRFSLLGNSNRRNSDQVASSVTISTVRASDEVDLSADGSEVQNRIQTFLQEEKHEVHREDMELSSYPSSTDRHSDSEDVAQSRYMHSNSKFTAVSKKGSMPKSRRRRGSGTQEMSEDLTTLSNQYTSAR